MKMKKYDFIVGIGTACFTSTNLRKSFLQFESYPFDWISTKSLIDNINFIVNEFNDFLEKDDLVNLKTTNGKKHSCYFYKNIKNGIIYPHDIEVDKNFNEAFEQVSNKYNRRINRLYNSIKNSKTVLLVYISLPNKDESEISHEDLNHSIKKICDYFNNDKIELLYIKPNKNFTYKKPKDYYVSDNVRIVEFDFSKYSKKHKLEIGDDFKMFKYLIKNFSLNISVSKKIIFIFNNFILKIKQYFI